MKKSQDNKTNAIVHSPEDPPLYLHRVECFRVGVEANAMVPSIRFFVERKVEDETKRSPSQPPLAPRSPDLLNAPAIVDNSIAPKQ